MQYMLAYADMFFRSHVLEHISRSRALSDDVGIAFIYYDYKQQSDGSQNLPHVICAMLKQLCWGSGDIQDMPQHLLTSYETDRSSSIVGNCEDFMAVVQKYREVFMVVDALDECTQENRTNMIEFLCTVSEDHKLTKAFVTSRRESDIVKAFEDFGTTPLQIEAKSTAKDIETYVKDEVQQLRQGRHGRFLHIPSNSLAVEVVKTLTSKANGM